MNQQIYIWNTKGNQYTNKEGNSITIVFASIVTLS